MMDNIIVATPRMLSLISSISIKHNDIVGGVGSIESVSTGSSSIPAYLHDFLVFIWLILLIIVVFSLNEF
jgi:hypothetical protein